MLNRRLITILLLINCNSSLKAQEDSSIFLANAKVVNKQTEIKQSIISKFDFLLDEDITESDPRIKSLVYSAKSYKDSKIEINYHNANAKEMADKLGLIFTRLDLSVLKPKQIPTNKMDKQSISRYVLVNINY